jgi:hypothetical protein
MLKKINDIASRLIAVILIFVLGLYLLNSFFNTHRHQLADGTIVVHAHPFERSPDSGPFETHRHTEIELVFLASLMHFIPSITVLLVGIVTITFADFSHTYQSFAHRHPFEIPCLRAPPACVDRVCS